MGMRYEPRRYWVVPGRGRGVFSTDSYYGLEGTDAIWRDGTAIGNDIEGVSGSLAPCFHQPQSICLLLPSTHCSRIGDGYRLVVIAVAR